MTEHTGEYLPAERSVLSAVNNKVTFENSITRDIICPKCGGVAFKQINFPLSLGNIELVDFEFSRDTLNTQHGTPVCDSCGKGISAGEVRRQTSINPIQHKRLKGPMQGIGR